MHRPETTHGYTPNVQIRFEAWWIRNKPNLKVWMQGDIPQLEKPIQLSAPYSDDKPFSITCMVPQDSLINWKVGVQDGNGPIRWANKSRCVYATYNFSASWLLWDDSPFDPPNLYHSHTTTSTTSTSSTYHSYHHNQPSTSSTPHTIPLPYERHNTSPQPSPRQTPVPQNTPLTPHTPTTHSSSNSTSMVTPTHHYTPNSAASSPFLTPNHQSSPLTSPRSIPMPKIHKSLLIGINYNGQPRHLSTPTQDVSTMRDLLSRFGYPDTSEYMRILVDEPSAMISPTRQHIMESLQWLVHDCKPGHQLFLMFSGFNTIVQSQYSEKEDTILPVDFQQTGEITDEILYQTLLSSLPSGVSLTIVMDGSQGGTLLELPYIYRSSRSSHISSEMTENPKWNNKARRYIQSRTALPKVYADVVSIGIEPNSASGDYSPRVDSCCRSLARIAQSSYQGLMWLEIMEQMKEMMPQRSPIMASNVASTLTKPFSL